MPYINIIERQVTGYEIRHFEQALFGFWTGHPGTFASSGERATSPQGLVLRVQRRTPTMAIYLITQGLNEQASIFFTEQRIGVATVIVATVDGERFDFVQRLDEWLSQL